MRCTFLLAMVFLAVSCSQRGMIDGVRLEYVSPDKTVSLAASSRLALPEVMRCNAIQLIQDTILGFRIVRRRTTSTISRRILSILRIISEPLSAWAEGRER